ncbi:MAG: aminoacyl-tRNA hydrolase [Clostridiales bacterium]|jgi:PTH1 family peptidyl-tRNA hydrolase|nr:aminoacyl-tRNA hydrolase [Clostridiales bacterium]
MLFFKNKNPIDFIIAGLGNPGQKYDKNRHNAGFNALDYISGRAGIEIKKLKHMSKTGTGVIAGKKVLLLKPQTFMNNSGEAIADAMRFYRLTPEQVLVIFDDVSLEVGKIRIRRSGSDGGHNGIKSIIRHLGTQDFPRVKIGVGQKPENYTELADWVLSDMSVNERNLICRKYDNIFDAVCLIINGDTEKAMQEYN